MNCVVLYEVFDTNSPKQVVYYVQRNIEIEGDLVNFLLLK